MNVIKVWICFGIFNHMNHISFLKSCSCWLHHCMLWKTCVFCWKLRHYNSEISAAIKLIYIFFSGVAILQVHCMFCWTTSKLCNNTSNHWEKPKYITPTPQTGQELVHGSWVIRGRQLVEHRVSDGSDVAPTVAQASLLVIGNLWLIRMDGENNESGYIYCRWNALFCSQCVQLCFSFVNRWKWGTEAGCCSFSRAPLHICC